jgi:hypothetical protein
MGVCEFVPLSFASGPRRAANIAGFQRSMTGFCQTVQQYPCVVTGQRPNGVANYASIDRTLRSWPASRRESRPAGGAGRRCRRVAGFAGPGVGAQAWSRAASRWALTWA